VSPPLFASSRPQRPCSRVDLPEPDGPISATNSPGRTARDTPRSASTIVPPSGYDRVTFRDSRIAPAVDHVAAGSAWAVSSGAPRSAGRGRLVLAGRGGVSIAIWSASKEQSGHAADDRLEQTVGPSGVDDAHAHRALAFVLGLVTWFKAWRFGRVGRAVFVTRLGFGSGSVDGDEVRGV